MVADRLKKLRGNLTQEAAAEIAQVTKGAYHSWETGKVLPKAEAAIKLCDHYGVTLDYLYRGIEGHIPSQQEGITDKEVKVIELWRELNGEEREDILLSMSSYIRARAARAERRNAADVLELDRRRKNGGIPSDEGTD